MKTYSPLCKRKADRSTNDFALNQKTKMHKHNPTDPPMPADALKH